MHAAKSILIVDDDPQIRRLLQTYFNNVGFRIHAVASGSEFRQEMSKTGADVVILDVTLPDESGFKLCQWMREHPDFSETPIIMLTGYADEMNRVLGLELGADDYLSKPFSLRELLARVRALMRRSGLGSKNTSGSSGQVLLFDDWCLDTVSRRLVHIDGEKVILTGTDFSLLKLFLDHPQQILDL